MSEAVVEAKRDLVNAIHSAISAGFNGEHSGACQQACDDAIDALMKAVREECDEAHVYDMIDAEERQ